MFNFLKAKKGKQIIEIIIMFPFVIFIILYSIVNLIAFVSASNVESTSNKYVRTLVTSKSFEDGLMNLYNNYFTQSNETTILNITVTDRVTSNHYTLSFSEDSEEQMYFKKMFNKAENSDKLFFNYEITSKFKENYNNICNIWERGNYVEITTMKPIAKIINSISKISIYNAQTKQRETLNYGVEGKVLATSKNIIIG